MKNTLKTVINKGPLSPIEDNKMEYRSEFLYDALINSTDDFIYVCNMKTGLFRYPPALVELFELPGEVVKDPLPYWKKIIHQDDWERFYQSNIVSAD